MTLEIEWFFFWVPKRWNNNKNVCDKIKNKNSIKLKTKDIKQFSKKKSIYFAQSSLLFIISKIKKY